MSRGSWFRDKAEMVWLSLLVFVLILSTVVVLAFTMPESYQITSLGAFAVALFISAGLLHLATQSRWRSRSLVVWVALVHVAIILSVPLLALTVFPRWQASVSAGSFKSVPLAIYEGFMLGLVLLIMNSIVRLFARWWSSWRDR